MADWKSSIIILFLALTSLVYILNEEKDNFRMEVSSKAFRYHSNWTNSLTKLCHRKQLEKGVRISTLKQLDLSFAHSNFQPNFASELFKLPFPSSLERVKLNVGSIPLENKDVEYLLSLVPNGIKSLEVHLDSINLNSGFGTALAYQLNRFTLLESLTVSLVLSIPKNQEQLGIFFKLHKPRESLKHLSLVLIGNSLEAKHIQRLPEYLAKFNLQTVDLNLYANKVGVEGAELISQALKTQQSLRNLAIDLYFNNVAQNGTKAICEEVRKLTNLQTLALNFDFNYIKNEGGKYIGSIFNSLTQLKELEIGVASKNFGYLGFKSVIDGMKTLTNLQKLTLRCGVNRVGINGAQIVKQMLSNMKNLQYLNLGFVQNYIGDEGLTLLSESISQISTIKSLMLNLGFNDAKSYGLINTLKAFSDRTYDYLFIGLSHNEFRDKDVELIKNLLPKLIQNNQRFDFDFVDTAVSKKMAVQIQNIFAKYSLESKRMCQVSVNSIIPEQQPEEKQKQEQTKPIKKDQRNQQKKVATEQRQVEEKVAAEKREAERIAAEKLAAEQREAERIAAEKLAAEQREAERIAAEKLAAEQREAERIAAEKLAAEQRETERIAAEKLAAEQSASSFVPDATPSTPQSAQSGDFIEASPIPVQPNGVPIPQEQPLKNNP